MVIRLDITFNPKYSKTGNFGWYSDLASLGMTDTYQSGFCMEENVMMLTRRVAAIGGQRRLIRTHVAHCRCRPQKSSRIKVNIELVSRINCRKNVLYYVTPEL